MKRIARGAEAGHFSIDPRAAMASTRRRLQDHHRRPFAHDEAIPVGVEWPRGLLWLIGAAREGTQIVKGSAADGRRGLHTASQANIDETQLDPAAGLRKRIIRTGTRRSNGCHRPTQFELTRGAFRQRRYVCFSLIYFAATSRPITIPATKQLSTAAEHEANPQLFLHVRVACIN